MGKGRKRKSAKPADKGKRMAVEGSDEDFDGGGSTDEEMEDKDEDAFKEITVDFEFFDPKEIDFHGLRALLGTYLDGDSFEVSDLVEAIIAQKSVGTILKTSENDEDPIGVVTALSLSRYGSLKPVSQVRQFLVDKCKDAVVKAQVKKAFDEPGTALLLTERLMNCPPQVAPPLMQAMFDEISWATEDEPTQELRESFKFKQYLICTRVYVDPDQSHQEAGGSSNKQKKEPVLVYIRPEDEFMHKRSSWSYSFKVESKQVAKSELQPWRLAMLIKADAVPAALKNLNETIGTIPGM